MKNDVDYWKHAELEEQEDTILTVLAKAHRFAIEGVPMNSGQYRALINQAIKIRQKELENSK